MILRFSDFQGDPVAVESRWITGLAVVEIAVEGDITEPGTAIRTVGGSVMVREPFDDVLAKWGATLGYDLIGTGSQPEQPMAVYPGVFPLVAHQYPDPATVTPPPWKPKAGWPEKGGGT